MQLLAVRFHTQVMLTRKTPLWLAACLTLPLNLEAKDLFVDSAAGSDAVSWAANSAAAPWRTIGRAAWGSANRAAPNASEAARAGDTVIVRAGTYLASATGDRRIPWFNPVNSGTQGAPIVFRAEGQVTLWPGVTQSGVARAGGARSIQLAADASTVNDFYAGWFVRIVSGTGEGQGRYIANVIGSSRAVTGSYDGSAQTAYLLHDWATVPNSGSAYQLTITGPIIGAYLRSHITWRGFQVIEGDSYHPDTGAVVVWESQHVVLDGLEVIGTVVPLHHDNHNGIRLNNANFITVRNCVIHGYRPAATAANNPQNSAAVMTYFTHDVLFENNLIYDTYTGFFPKGGSNSRHTYRYNIVRDCARAFRASFTTYTAITQNVIYDCDEGFQPAEGNDQVRFYNNVMYGGSMGVQNWFATGGFLVLNNVVAGATYPQFWEGGHGTFSSDRNVYSGYTRFQSGSFRGNLGEWRAHSGYDLNSAETTADRLFVNAAARDFRLQPGSPALIVGRDSFDCDGDGDVLEAIAAGAYITGTEIIGPSGAAPPPPPPPPVANAAPTRPRSLRLQ